VKKTIAQLVVTAMKLMICKAKRHPPLLFQLRVLSVLYACPERVSAVV
jgi:hypothetical protein